jgi:DNA-binding CsgD family transcriptional regulator/tetratricopeptide (TPR) repeat protein
MARASPELERGRGCYASGAWLEANAALRAADEVARLDGEDLELLARSAYMLGRDDEYVGALERAHHVHLDAGEPRRAVRCAFWIGHNMLFRGDTVRARGWFARAHRLLERDAADCVERGWMLIPVWLEEMARGEWEAGYDTAGEAAAIGERFRDSDLVWLARDDQARALVKRGRVEDGLRLLDEALVVATAGELSPVVAGIVFCNTIAFCSDAYEVPHARAWTDALTSWCDGQPEMVAHNGLCLVHRAEILQMRGAWTDALEQASCATERFTQGVLNQLACGKAHYRRGEVHRLRGELAAAEAGYREANRCGCDPQPGMALLRLAQKRSDAAAAAIRRAVGEATEPLRRAALLPAYVEIMLGCGDVETARSASRQLNEIADRQGSNMLTAMSEYARAAVALAADDPRSGLAAARQSSEAWRDLDVPYEVARARVLIGVACNVLGDDDAAEMELEAARAVFAELGARPDVAHVDALGLSDGREDVYGLTRRELEVLRLVAAGKSNREIAESLVISDRTVARHLQNIFAKLRVTSRTAASAFAFERDLV